jgi:hypothetical protein
MQDSYQKTDYGPLGPWLNLIRRGVCGKKVLLEPEISVK